MLKNIKTWISAMRLRTLPLALSCIITGSALTFANHHYFNINIFILACITTICLQVLSNLANDYGDSKKGTDNEKRIGPLRAVQSGEISLDAMKNGVIIASILSFISGLALLYVAFGWQYMIYTLLFIVIGVGAIIAAIKYTVGKNPYGYNALGDLFVFLFFGIVGVIGVSFLYIKGFRILFLLPAFTIGGLSAGVLNLNNMRDIENDTASNKITIAIKLGLQNAKIYQVILVLFSLLSLVAFTLLVERPMITSWVYLLAFPLFLFHCVKVLKTNVHKDFNPMLPMLAMSTFLLSILFFMSRYM
jgi:1,4-dihydroxy-2-naphthoate octaprenyltransferase